ncbi:cytochrome c oxidase subunit II [Euzebya rosea]|uniref:cytochrome c oxidase subunit II n=1 Tax=Euzebya rosea TaxID=2052804 RepID=UPI000D3E26C0|nr:cytochrome c oxidase subunit II [Euzebya rosea]
MGRRPADAPTTTTAAPPGASGRVTSTTDRLRESLPRLHRRAYLALGGLAMLATGCSVDLDGSDTAQIPGPNPNRPLPADALNPLGPVARSQDELWDIAYPITIAVFLLVFGGLAFIVVRFRDKGQTELPKQVHGNTRLEIAWTLIPAVILAVIAVPTVQKIFELAEPPAEDAVLVTAVGKQYWWEFQYTEEDFYTASELHIPVGREVFIELDGTADGADVIHSFWVPSLAGKRDYVPGGQRQLRIEADEPGVYPGLCAEFCGLSHANMRFTVIAHEEADYEAWVDRMQQPVAEPEDELVAQGAEIAGSVCIGCHTFTGLEGNADSRFGPNLTHFAAREAFAGYIFDSPFGDEVEDPELAMERMEQWIRDPQSLKPGAQMPGFGSGGDALTDEQIDAVIAYLGTLE